MKKYILPSLLLFSLFSCKDKTNDQPQPKDDALVITKADFDANYKPGGAEFTSFDAPTSAVTIPVAGANQTWDFSQLTELSTTNLSGSTYFTVNNPEFSSATFGTTVSKRWVISGASSATFPSDDFYELNNSGFYYLGNTQNQATNIDIPSLGANISFPVQNLPFTGVTKSPLITFPIKLGDEPVVTNGIITANAYVVNAPAFGLNNTPGSNRVTINETVEVIGSGTVNLKGIGNKRVLLIKQSYSERTNFFLNGSPTPTALLDQLGATDGATTTGTTYRFIGEGLGIVGNIFVNGSGNITRANFRKQ